MITYLPRWSRYGTFAAFALACSACTAPSEYSDLRPDGPPEVLTVSVNAIDTRATSGEGASVEQATFCKTQGPNDGAAGAGDSQRPDQVNTVDLVPLIVCPEDLTKGVDPRTDALPESWYARIEFDELLDPSIEDLVANVDAKGMPDGTYTGTIKNTQPVTLKCDSVTGSGQVDVPYDGYYSPSGDKISYPLGPSLVIIPTDASVIATSSSCTVTLKENITDKDGNQVPADQRGPYTWKTGPVTIIAIDPPDGGGNITKVDPVAAGVDVTFNTSIDPTSLDAVDAGGDSTVWAFTPTVDNAGVAQESGEEFFFFGDFPSAAGPYNFSFLAGAKIADQCGKVTTLGAPSVDDFTETTFKTNPLKLSGITGATEPGNKVQITFNQYMDPDSLLATEYTIDPPLANARVEPDASLTKLLIAGDYKLGTAYTFTLKSGATIDDCPGGESSFIGGTCATSATYTSPMDQTVMFTTASAIVLKTITPADNSTAASQDTVGITLTFNQEIDPSTLVQDVDYTISPNVAMKPTTNRDVPAPGPGTYEQLRIAPVAPFPPGTYTFTLLKSGSVSDLIVPPDTFSPSSDTVTHFTVTANPPAHVCL